MADPPLPRDGAPLSQADLEELDHRDPTVRKWLIDRPGPSWTEWFYHSFAKTYLLLGLFVGDAMVAAAWLEMGSLIGLAASLLVLIYLEYLLYQYLWHEPASDSPHRSFSTRQRAVEGRSWLHPWAFGRWSPTGQRVRAGLEPARSTGADGPDPREFL